MRLIDMLFHSLWDCSVLSKVHYSSISGEGVIWPVSALRLVQLAIEKNHRNGAHGTELGDQPINW